MKWAGEHPVFLGVSLLLGVGFLGAYPLPALFVLTTLAVGVGLFQWMIRLDKRSREQIGRRQALVAHADYEHHLIVNGDARGVFGQYPPAV